MQIAERNKVDHLLAWLSTAFAVSAMLLTAIGLHALMSFLGRRRRTEIGIRLALRAERRQVVRLTMRELWLIAVPGIVCGVVLAVLLARFVQSEVFGIRPTDPILLCLAASFVLLICVVAAYVPARRSTMLDPSAILRCE